MELKAEYDREFILRPGSAALEAIRRETSALTAQMQDTTLGLVALKHRRQ